jgi:hypothetical protein
VEGRQYYTRALSSLSSKSNSRGKFDISNLHSLIFLYIYIFSNGGRNEQGGNDGKLCAAGRERKV